VVVKALEQRENTRGASWYATSVTMMPPITSINP
jgi:hypothetical protein